MGASFARSVTTGTAQSEHNESDVHLIADTCADSPSVRTGRRTSTQSKPKRTKSLRAAERHQGDGVARNTPRAASGTKALIVALRRYSAVLPPQARFPDRPSKADGHAV